MKISIAKLLILTLFLALLLRFNANPLVVWPFVIAGYIDGYSSNKPASFRSRLFAGTVGGLIVVCIACVYLEIAVIAYGWRKSRDDPTRPMFLEGAADELIYYPAMHFVFWSIPCWIAVLANLLLKWDEKNRQWDDRDHSTNSL